MILLAVKNLTKKYGNLTILNNIDFQINNKEIVAIIGKSGAGKSTFLQTLSTLDSFNEGKLFFKGQELKMTNSKQIQTIRNINFGYIFQAHHLLPEFTALENILIPTMIANANTKLAKERALQYLAYLDLLDRKDHLPSELSGGEQQRIAAIRAVINKPDIIFADEPTGNLDQLNTKIIMNLFLKLNQEYSTSIILVTHNLELTAQCHKVFQLENQTLKSIK